MAFRWKVIEGMNTLLPSLGVWGDKNGVKQKNVLFQFLKGIVAIMIMVP